MLYLYLSVFLIGAVSTDVLHKSSIDLNQEVLAVQEFMKGWSRQIPRHVLLEGHKKGINSAKRLMKHWAHNSALSRSRLSHWVQFQSFMETAECDNPSELDSTEFVYCICDTFWSDIIADDASIDSYFDGTDGFEQHVQSLEAECDNISGWAQYSAMGIGCHEVALGMASEYQWFLTTQGNQTSDVSTFCGQIVAASAVSPTNPQCAIVMHDLLFEYADVTHTWIDFPGVLDAPGFDAVFLDVCNAPGFAGDDCEALLTGIHATSTVGDFCNAVNAPAIFEAPPTE